MRSWFYDPDLPFEMWDQIHLITLLIMLILLVVVYIFRRHFRPYRRTIYISLAFLFLLSRLSLDFWYIYTGHWKLSSSLPLELCSISSFLCALMLLTRHKFLVEVLYFIALSGSLQALVTPELYFGFPQYRYLQFFLDHFLLLLSPLLMIWLEDVKIKAFSIIKAWLFLNGLALLVYMLNKLLQANYMYLMYKPSTPSLMDYLGDHPYYLLSLEVIALVLFSVLYLFFRASQEWKGREVRESSK